MTSLSILLAFNWPPVIIIISAIIVISAAIIFMKAAYLNSYLVWKEHCKKGFKYYRWALKAEYLKFIKEDEDFERGEDDLGYYFKLK